MDKEKIGWEMWCWLDWFYFIAVTLFTTMYVKKFLKVCKVLHNLYVKKIS